MSNVLFKSGTSSKFATITPDQNTFYWLTDSNDLFFGSSKITNAADLSAAVTRIGTAEGKITALETLTTLLNNTDQVEGSIKYQIKAAIEALDGTATIASKNSSTNVVTLKAGLAEVDGVVSNSSDSDIVLAAVASTGSAADVSNTAINGVTKDVSGTPTSTTNVQDTLEALKGLIDNTGSAGSIYAVEGGASGDVLKSYTLYQGGTPTVDSNTGKTTAVTGGTTITTINVPKDYLVKDADVSTVTSEDKATGGKFEDDASFAVGDKYIDFTVNTIGSDGTATHLYINVDDLMSALTVEANADEVQLTLSATNQLSADIVDIAASKITYIAEDAGNSVSRESVGAALQRLDGTDSTTGSVAKKIKDAVEALDAVEANYTVGTGGASDSDVQSDGLKVKITQADGVITAVDASIVANTYDSYGAASAVLGTNADDADDKTVYGAFAAVDDLETYVGTIPAKGGIGDDADQPMAASIVSYIDLKTGAGISALDSTATIATKSGNTVVLKTGLSEVDGIVTNDSGTDITLSDVSVTGQAISVSVADANSLYNGTTVEACLAEVRGIADQNATALTWQEF